MKLLRFMLDNTWISLGDRSYRPTRDVPQGLSCSPYLFDIFFDLVLSQMTNKGICALAFADDVAAIADSENEMVKIINVFNRECQNWVWR